MKKLIALGLVLMSSVAAVAGQESYGLPGGPAQPIGPLWHVLGCSVPYRGQAPIVGVGYQLRFATAALAPQYNVVAAVLEQRAVVLHPVWHDQDLTSSQQDLQSAVFTGSGVIVTIDKENFTAEIQFQSGATSECGLN